MYSLYDITRVCPKLEPHFSPNENENHDQDHVTNHVESQGELLPCKTETLDYAQRKVDYETVAKENESANEILDRGASLGDQPIKSHSEFDRKLPTDIIDSADSHRETAGQDILAHQPRVVHRKNNHDSILSPEAVRQSTMLARLREIEDTVTQGTMIPYQTSTARAETVYQKGTQGTTLTDNMSTYAMGEFYNGDTLGTIGQEGAIYQGDTQGITVHCNIFTDKVGEEYHRDTQGTTISYNARAVPHTGTQKTTFHCSTSPYKVAEPGYQGTMLPFNISNDQGVVPSQGCTQEAKLPYRGCSDRQQELDHEALPPYDTYTGRIDEAPLNHPQGTKSEVHIRRLYYDNVPAHRSNGGCCCSCHVTKFSTSHCPAFGQQNQRPSVIMVPIKWRESGSSVWTPKDVPYSSDEEEEDEANEEKYFRKNIDGKTAKFMLSKEDWKRIPINAFPSGGRLLSGDWTKIFLSKVKESNPWCNLRFKNNHVRSENSRKIHSAVFFRGGAECKRPECNVKVRFVIRKEKGKYVDVTYVGDVCHSSQPGGSDITNENRRSKRVRKPGNLRDKFLS